MTKDIKHHLTDDLLMAYSAGAMPEAFSLVIATHVSMCDDCRSRLDAFDAVGGALIEHAEEVEISESALAATLAMIAEQDAGMADPVQAPEGAVLPEPLRGYVKGGLDAVRWRSVGGGVRQAVLETDAEATVRLLHIPAGARMPDHGHRGMEMTLVLKGAFTDEFDRFARGDLEIANEDHQHTPVAEMGEDCICLAATDAPLIFKGVIPRIAQRFIGI